MNDAKVALTERQRTDIEIKKKGGRGGTEMSESEGKKSDAGRGTQEEAYYLSPIVTISNKGGEGERRR